MDLLLNCGRMSILITLIILSTFAAAEQQKWKHRKLTTTLFSDDLAYVKAEGSHDILHYLFSGHEEMSILSIKSGLNATITRDIKLKPPGSFIHAFGIVFNKLIEYNDSDDEARITHYPPESWKYHSTAMKMEDTNSSGIFFKKELASGNVTFSFHNFGDEKRQDVLPHLLVISNSSLINLVINGVKPSFKNSRFALATTYISYGNSSHFDIKSEKSLDDEFTPGTFEVSNWVAAGGHNSFLQWKPICYLDTERSTRTSTYVRVYQLASESSNSSLPWNSSIAYNYFTSKNDYNLTYDIISFGRSADKFYTKSQYTTWSATVGYGAPPADKISIMAIAIISVGLGIPVLMFMGGGIYLCMKRRRSGYQQVFGTIST